MSRETESWDEVIEEARQYAESKMGSWHGESWDRKDYILIGAFYRYFLYYIEITYNLHKKYS